MDPLPLAVDGSSNTNQKGCVMFAVEALDNSVVVVLALIALIGFGAYAVAAASGRNVWGIVVGVSGALISFVTFWQALALS